MQSDCVFYIKPRQSETRLYRKTTNILVSEETLNITAAPRWQCLV